MIEILGEMFSVHEEDGYFFVTHPQWSLMGAGRTVEEAQAGMLAEGRELAEEMANDDESSLSRQAVLLRTFVLGIS